MVAIKNMFAIVRVGLTATASVLAAYYTFKRFQNKKNIESSHQDAQSCNSMSLSGKRLPVMEEVERVNNSSNDGHKLVAQNVKTIKEHKELLVEEEEEAKRVGNSSINGHELAAQNVKIIKAQNYPALEEEEEFKRVNNSSMNGHKLIAQNVKEIKEQEEKDRCIRANGPLSEQPTQHGKINNIHIELTEVHKGPSRVAKLPPIPSPSSIYTPAKATCGKPTPPHPNPQPSALGAPRSSPPLPPPPPPSGMFRGHEKKSEKLQRAPELLEFHHLLVKRQVKKEFATLRSATTNVAEAQCNLIAQLEKRSSFLRLVKDDVETQGELVESLARQVRTAAFTKIEDIVSFVKWLDEELSILGCINISCKAHRLMNVQF